MSCPRRGMEYTYNAIPVTRVGRPHAVLKICLSVHASRTAYTCIEGKGELIAPQY